MKKKQQIKISVSNSNQLIEDFYNFYNPDYWLDKVTLLKNVLDNFTKFKKTIFKDLVGVDEDQYKRFLKTEIHFTYLHIIEALFELIFAIAKRDNRIVWYSITFSPWKQNYEFIQKIAESKTNFLDQTVKFKSSKKEISLLKYIFYFTYNLTLKEEGQNKNIENIKKLLRIFAKDFSDRNGYNAYKHSLRFYHSSFGLSIGLHGSPKKFNLGQSEDAIFYLEKDKKNQLRKVIKPFDYERDFRLCLIIHSMISNIINTRKYSILKKLHGKKFDLHHYKDIKFPEIATPKTGVTKFSSTI